MIFCPKYEEYDIKVLILLGNQTSDVFTRNKIKLVLIEKILELNKPMFYLVNKFINSDRILKEVYADVIMIYMKENEYYINDNIVDEILKFASLDGLIYYGADSKNIEFSIKCKEEFDNRAKLIEDKIELNKKRKLDKIESGIIFRKRKR